MGRRATDLFDVFRPGDASRKGRAAAPPAPRREKPAADRTPRRRFEGLFLAPRQVLLAGSVGVLLLVLAFTVGLGVGRRGGAAAPEPSLRRETTIWVFRGTLAPIDAARGERMTDARIVRDLERSWGIPRSMVRVDPVKDALVISLGPLASEEEAKAFQEAKRLAAVRVGIAAPFRFAKPEAVRVR
jgi:hypothetical protein